MLPDNSTSHKIRGSDYKGLVNLSLQIIKKAEQWVIRSVRKGQYHQIVLCTCSAAGSNRVRDGCNNTIQCIVDECGMCLEPETLIPVVWSRAKQVVLIGDHMQLQPIVINRTARSLGLSKSLFERYSNDALMLEEQYRMVSSENSRISQCSQYVLLRKKGKCRD